MELRNYSAQYRVFTLHQPAAASVETSGGTVVAAAELASFLRNLSGPGYQDVANKLAGAINTVAASCSSAVPNVLLPIVDRSWRRRAGAWMEAASAYAISPDA